MDLNFEDILNELTEIHENYPDLRFGEVIQNSLDRAKNGNNINLNDRSSKEILNAVIEFKKYTERLRNNGN